MTREKRVAADSGEDDMDTCVVDSGNKALNVRTCAAFTTG